MGSDRVAWGGGTEPRRRTHLEISSGVSGGAQSTPLGAVSKCQTSGRGLNCQGQPEALRRYCRPPLLSAPKMDRFYFCPPLSTSPEAELISFSPFVPDSILDLSITCVKRFKSLIDLIACVTIDAFAIYSSAYEIVGPPEEPAKISTLDLAKEAEPQGAELIPWLTVRELLTGKAERGHSNYYIRFRLPLRA